jgi:hypothetical protein
MERFLLSSFIKKRTICIRNTQKHTCKMTSPPQVIYPKYFTNRLGISTRTLQRLIRYLNKIDNLKVQYDKSIDLYYLKTV